MEEQKQTFDPNKKYQWQPEDKFELDGFQFSVMLNAIRAFLSSEDAMKVLLLKEASDNLEKVLAESVNSGKVKEMEEKPVIQGPLTLEKEVPIS